MCDPRHLLLNWVDRIKGCSVLLHKWQHCCRSRARRRSGSTALSLFQTFPPSCALTLAGHDQDVSAAPPAAWTFSSASRRLGADAVGCGCTETNPRRRTQPDQKAPGDGFFWSMIKYVSHTVYHSSMMSCWIPLFHVQRRSKGLIGPRQQSEP